MSGNTHNGFFLFIYKRLPAMKKIVLLLMCCLGIFGSVSAANVSKSMVLQVAIKACNLVSSSDFSSKKYQIEPISYQGELCYYLVQFQPEGWALVSAVFLIWSRCRMRTVFG